MGGRLGGRKRGNIRVSGSTFGEESAMPPHEKFFLRQVAACENVFPIHASSGGEHRPICIGGI
jgi:hypothetical protein